jgi:hypothetical protein
LAENDSKNMTQTLDKYHAYCYEEEASKKYSVSLIDVNDIDEDHDRDQ